MIQHLICSGDIIADTLSKAVETFPQHIRPERERLFDYYHSLQPVPKGEAVRGRPNNLLHAPFPRYIIEVQTGYFLGVLPTFSFSSPQCGDTFTHLSQQLELDHRLFGISRD